VTAFGLFLTPIFYVLLRTLEKKITGRHVHEGTAYTLPATPAIGTEAPHNYEG
jgi:multidrug efflux pump